MKLQKWHDGAAGVKCNNFGLHDFMARNANIYVFEHTLKEMVFGALKLFSRNYTRLYSPTDIEREAISWARKGYEYLGLAVATTKPLSRGFGIEVLKPLISCRP